MARKETLNQRAARLNRRVAIQVELSVATLAELDELAPHFAKTRQEVIQSAVFEWTWRYRKKYTRRERLSMEKAIRETRDEVPMGPLLARFQAQMEAASSGRPVDIASHSVQGGARLSAMESESGTNRQVKADLDAEFYDQIAAIAKGDDRSIAYLIRKGLEKVAAEHEASQAQGSSIAAA